MYVNVTVSEMARLEFCNFELLKLYIFLCMNYWLLYAGVYIIHLLAHDQLLVKFWSDAPDLVVARYPCGWLALTPSL